MQSFTIMMMVFVKLRNVVYQSIILSVLEFLFTNVFIKFCTLFVNILRKSKIYMTENRLEYLSKKPRTFS
jgi:hypothetical protein